VGLNFISTLAERANEALLGVKRECAGCGRRMKSGEHLFCERCCRDEYDHRHHKV